MKAKRKANPRVDLESVPPEHRFIEIVSPGLFFGDTCEIKWPKKSWSDSAALARELKRGSKDRKVPAVGYMRFVYDPAEGKTYLDDGWQYFGGVKLTKEECLSGKAKEKFPDIPLTEIALFNIKYNGWDVLYVQSCNVLWPLHEGDQVV